MPTPRTLRLRMTSFGALVGGALAFLWTDLLEELLLVALGAAVGWVVAYALSILAGAYASEARVADTAITRAESSTREELYEQASRLGIDGRSTMTKDELAVAVAREAEAAREVEASR